MQLRSLVVMVTSALALLAGRASAEEWVAKMFSESSHDFGTVARGADTSYRFAIKNLYKQDIELVSVTLRSG